MKKINDEGDIERIAILNHETHELYIEDIPLDILEKKYNNEEENFIKDNYPDLGFHSWDYIVNAYYMPYDYDAIEINFDEL